jgi:hypothetical protein
MLGGTRFYRQETKMDSNDSARGAAVPFFERFLERLDPADGALIPTPTRRDDAMPSV